MSETEKLVAEINENVRQLTAGVHYEVDSQYIQSYCSRVIDAVERLREAYDERKATAG